LYPAKPNDSSSKSYIGGEVPVENGNSSGPSASHSYPYHTENYPSIGSTSDIFAQERGINFDSEEELFQSYIAALYNVEPKASDTPEQRGLFGCDVTGDCPGYGAPAYYPFAAYDDWGNAQSAVRVRNGSILFRQKEILEYAVNPGSEEDYIPSCGSGLAIDNDGNVLPDDDLTNIKYCQSNNHSRTPRGGAIVIVW